MGVIFNGGFAVTTNGPLQVSQGGTGETTVTDAINALLPSQTNNTGYVLTTDGTDVSWAPATGGGTPGGLNAQVQFNNSGSFGGSSSFTWNTNTSTLTAANISGSGTAITSLNASNLASGTVGTARLGTGTADSTTYLRGDGTWAIASATVDASDLTGTTLATNVVTATLTSLRPVTVSSGAGSALSIAGGQGATLGAGGALNLTGGAFGSGSQPGGNVVITGGAAGSGAQAGGVQIVGASGGGTAGNGGSITLTAGNTGNGTGAQGGAITITAGNNGTGGPAGVGVTITGGQTGSSSNAAGAVTLVAGPNTNSGAGGNIVITAGTSASGTGGSIILSTTAGSGAAVSERFRIAPAGAIGLSGANYGTSGQVLTSGGSDAAPTWATITASATTLSASSAMPSISAAGVYAGIQLTFPMIEYYNDAATTGGRMVQSYVDASGNYNLAFAADNGSGTTVFLKSTRTSGTATTSNITLTGTAITLTGAVTGTSFSGTGSSLTSLNASNLSSGTVATARLGTGTADSTTYLRGDGSWSAVSAGGNASDTVQTVTATSSTTLNANSGGAVKVAMNASITTLAFSNVPSSQFAFTLYLTQDATGARTITWPSSVKWAGGGAPVLTITGAKTDIISLVTVDSGTTWYGSVVGLNF